MGWEWSWKYFEYGDEYFDRLNDWMLASLMIIGAGNESGMAAAFGGDIKAANTAGIKVFKYIETSSKVDTLNIDPEKKKVDMENFNGNIEFKDVWFRYPTRKTEWVF